MFINCFIGHYFFCFFSPLVVFLTLKGVLDVHLFLLLKWRKIFVSLLRMLILGTKKLSVNKGGCREDLTSWDIITQFPGSRAKLGSRCLCNLNHKPKACISYPLAFSSLSYVFGGFLIQILSASQQSCWEFSPSRCITVFQTIWISSQKGERRSKGNTLGEGRVSNLS